MAMENTNSSLKIFLRYKDLYLHYGFIKRFRTYYFGDDNGTSTVLIFTSDSKVRLPEIFSIMNIMRLTNNISYFFS